MNSGRGMMAAVVTGALALLAIGVTMPARAAAPGKRRAPTASADDTSVKRGAEAWEAGNYARALTIWRPLATAGNADAQYNLAQSYRLGRGVPVDEAQAREWYLKAAKQDHPEAQANYGLLLFQGNDRMAALPWLSKAAARGDARAQYVLGTALFNGDLYGKDWVRAYALMTRAAASGLPQASTSLAAMDRYIPIGQRQQGTALARDMERSEVLDQAGAASDRLVRARGEARDRIVIADARATPPAATTTPRAVRPATTTARPTPSGAEAASPPVAITATGTPPRADTSAPGRARPAATPPAPAAGGGWRVQVGAFADPAAATAAWSGISGKVPGLALRSYLVKAGAVTRLQAGPLATRADASRMCVRITAAGGAGCFPVAAP